MIPRELEGILVSTPDTLGGTLRFVGTRVPVQALLDSRLSGETLEAFLDGYPEVTEVQARAVLDWEDTQARRALGLQTRAS